MQAFFKSVSGHGKLSTLTLGRAEHMLLTQNQRPMYTTNNLVKFMGHKRRTVTENHDRF